MVRTIAGVINSEGAPMFAIDGSLVALLRENNGWRLEERLSSEDAASRR
jgi:hypothetical protein